MPPAAKTEDLLEIEDWLAGLLRGTDSSLLDEWERLQNPDWRPAELEAQQPQDIDITRNKREFTALIRAEIFQLLRALAAHRYDAAAELVAPWTSEQLQETLAPYYDEHQRLTLDPEARSHKHTYITVNDDENSWTVSQVLVDPDALNDWQATFTIDKTQARELGRPVLQLLAIGPI